MKKISCNQAMIFLYALTLLSTMSIVFGLTEFGTSPRRDLTFIELAKYDGYTAEQHFVTTKDGYILGLFRIPLKKNCSASNGPIMFMHGLYLSSDDCLVPGPGKAHCYIYADNCYDVWAPNIRGNVYSRNHTKYNPDKDANFWNFSIDEMAIYDVPAIIDYVLLKTNATEIPYIGHSQGIAILLILCSKKSEYNSKIKVAFGLSSTASLYHTTFIVVKLQGLIAPALTLTNSLLNTEILSRGGFIQNYAKLLCGLSELSYPFCSALIFATLGYNEYEITSDVLPVLFGHAPSGTSLKNFISWGQIYNNGFSEYDYGSSQNLQKYRQANPPMYDLSGVTVPWVFVGSDNDNVANVTDVKTLVSKLPSASLCVLSNNKFGHLDFIYGKNIPNYITPIVLSYLKTGNYVCP